MAEYNLRHTFAFEHAASHIPASYVTVLCGLQIHKVPASLEAPAGPHNEDSSLADFVEDDTDMTPGDAAVHKMLTQDMNQLLYTLSERESEVLRLRYGLEDGQERTLEEVGRVMMVSARELQQSSPPERALFLLSSAYVHVHFVAVFVM